ncbi:MAG: phosphonate metabolism transcriptional regulator PhnF [Betaproteobacteria bacterium HGW-Betaproteobacteria-22]|nr:MAG: phosphonate metabolism transcriptional regulator PhnF [Betaproteobacteria bacterium HGW-Betaproteobacteria-22]
MSLFAINRHNGEAVYSQIARSLLAEIGQLYRLGEYLPSEAELAARFGVNRHTVRRAIDEIVHAGVVERQHGKGTRVLDAAMDYALGERTRFTEQLEAEGMSATTRILRKLVIPAHGGVAARLKLKEGASVVWMETLRLVDERPYCLISHFLPEVYFSDALEAYAGGSLHAYISTRYQVNLRRSESLVTASMPLGDDARLLNMPQHQAVLRVKSVNVNAEKPEIPMEYALTRFRADRIQLRIRP